MLLPKLQENQTVRQTLTGFGGYCRREPNGAGQFYQMDNIDWSFGTLASRPPRQCVRALDGCPTDGLLAMCELDGPVFVDRDGTLCAAGCRLPGFADPAYNGTPRQLVPMGAFVILWPDRRWANVAALRAGGQDVCGSLDAAFTQPDSTGKPAESDDFWSDTTQLPGAVKVVRRENYAVRVSLTDEAGTPLFGPPPADAVPREGELLCAAAPPLLEDGPGRVWIDTSVNPARIYALTAASDLSDPDADYPCGKDLAWCYRGEWPGWYTASAAPKSPDDGCLWMDLSSGTPVLKRWSASAAMWSEVKTWLKLWCKMGFAGFAAGDAVELTLPRLLFTDDRKGVIGESMYLDNPNPNGTVIVSAAGENYLVVPGIVPRELWIGTRRRQLVICAQAARALNALPDLPDADYWTMDTAELIALIDGAAAQTPGYRFAAEQTAAVTITRRAPDMDYLIECRNRLWGCRFATVDGTQINEIYASKLGDFKNWRCFAGLADDSYAASRGLPGAWTGAASFGDYPIFFKQDAFEKIYVSPQGAHQIVTVRAPGIASGSSRSAQVLAGVLYYLSPAGVMAYDGSLPVCISHDLGDGALQNGAAGTLEGRYVLSAETQNGGACFVYDPDAALWTRHDAAAFRLLHPAGQGLFLQDADGWLAYAGPARGDLTAEPEPPVVWRLTTGPIGFDRPEQAYLLRLNLRMALGSGAQVHVFLRYDEQPRWHLRAALDPGGPANVTIPIRPRRCGHFRLKLTGVGPMKLYSLSRELEYGSAENPMQENES